MNLVCKVRPCVNERKVGPGGVYTEWFIMADSSVIISLYPSMIKIRKVLGCISLIQSQINNFKCREIPGPKIRIRSMYKNFKIQCTIIFTYLSSVSKIILLQIDHLWCLYVCYNVLYKILKYIQKQGRYCTRNLILRSVSAAIEAVQKQ